MWVGWHILNPCKGCVSKFQFGFSRARRRRASAHSLCSSSLLRDKAPLNDEQICQGGSDFDATLPGVATGEVEACPGVCSFRPESMKGYAKFVSLRSGTTRVRELNTSSLTSSSISIHKADGRYTATSVRPQSIMLITWCEYVITFPSVIVNIRSLQIDEFTFESATLSLTSKNINILSVKILAQFGLLLKTGKKNDESLPSTFSFVSFLLNSDHATNLYQCLAGLLTGQTGEYLA